MDQLNLPYLIPLGIVGTWRWSVWGIKRITGLFYRPAKNSFTASLAIVTPVYNEDPVIFKHALRSWKANNPDEIIAVIDYTDARNIAIFKSFARGYRKAKLIVTKKPGKRPALADGIRVATSELVALVDCDTLWEKNARKHLLMPFVDPKVGAVAPRQGVLQANTLAQKLFSIRLAQRYWDDVPFLSITSKRLQCVSGRTAVYRRSIVRLLLKDLVNEFFFGERVISGEDKRLTYLVEALGHRAVYQSTAQVYTTGAETLSVYFKQQVRWMRNTWRANLRALKERWVFRYPVFALYLIDSAIQPFTLILSPIYFAIAIALGLWQAALVIFIWWHVSRAVKIYPYLRKHPRDLLLLTPYIFISFVQAYYKLFALITLNAQGWITRWDKSRLPQYTVAQAMLPHLIIIAFIAAVLYHKQRRLLHSPPAAKLSCGTSIYYVNFCPHGAAKKSTRSFNRPTRLHHTAVCGSGRRYHTKYCLLVQRIS